MSENTTDMNNQAKRWTAIDRGIYHGKDLVACGNKVWGKLSDDCATAARLAACADLLRGVDDLSAVESLISAAREESSRHMDSHDPKHPCPCALCAIVATLPVPTKGDA